jgi:hypothetical protein
MRYSLVLTCCLLALPAFAAPAGKERPPAKGKTDPPGAPLEARLVVKKAVYVLDRGGKAPTDYLAEAKKKPPRVDVDLVLEIRNTSAGDIKLWMADDYRDEKRQAGGDYVELVLDLQGPGAVSAVVATRFTRPATPPPRLATIKAGKSFVLPITSLSYGRHGVARYQGSRAAWTQAGDYTLTATFRTAVSPAPKGSKETRWAHFEGGIVSVTTPPVKLKVVEAKKKP